MSDIVVGLDPDLAETPPRTCSRAVAQNNRSPPGQQKAITTGEGNRLRNPSHTQPAVAARNHGEVRQICGCLLFVGRRDFFFGLLFLFYAPRGCGFEPVQTESGYVHRSEDVCYWVQLSFPLLDEWTKVLDSRAVLVHCQRIYSTVLNASHLSKGVIMGKLEGKVAVITGGSSGLALASAKRFVEEGAYVFIVGRRQEALDEAVKLIGRNVTGVRGDVSNLDALDRLFDTVKREKCKIDVLFASAGKGEAAKLGEITEQHFDAGFGLIVRGTLFTVQKGLPLFNDGGSIIMTGSVASVKGFPGFGVYAASKAALRSFARTWLNELKGRNIRVNVLGPGPIATPMQEEVLTKEAKEMFASLIPRGKMGQPEEIATVALFLASDDSSFVNGVELCVDGGFSAI